MAQVGKALVLSEQGGPEVLSIDPSYKTPAPGAHELQVKITGASLSNVKPCCGCNVEWVDDSSQVPTAATSMEHVSWIVRQGYFGALGKTPEVCVKRDSSAVPAKEQRARQLASSLS